MSGVVTCSGFTCPRELLCREQGHHLVQTTSDREETLKGLTQGCRTTVDHLTLIFFTSEKAKPKRILGMSHTDFSNKDIVTSVCRQQTMSTGLVITHSSEI